MVDQGVVVDLSLIVHLKMEEQETLHQQVLHKEIMVEEEDINLVLLKELGVVVVLFQLEQMEIVLHQVDQVELVELVVAYQQLSDQMVFLVVDFNIMLEAVEDLVILLVQQD